MTELNFHFPVTPQPKLRARITRLGRSYTPKKSKWAEQELQAYALKQLPKGWKPSPHHASVSIGFYFKRPKSAKKREHHTVKPDLDNLIKMVMDSFNGIVWEDDTQVTAVTAYKQYSSGNTEGIHMSVRFQE